MKNRIASLPSEEFQRKFLGHLEGLIEMTNELIQGTHPDDLKVGQDMGTGDGYTFVRDAFSIARDHPKFIEDDNSSLKDFETDIIRANFLLPAQERVAVFQKQFVQATLLTGKDLMEQAGWVLSELRKRKESPKYADLYERLNALYLKRQKRAEATRKIKASSKLVTA
jgi:hypothetical protein